MRYSYVIIDGNNAFWRAWYVESKNHLKNQDVVYTGGISQFLANIEKLRKDYCYTNNTKLYFLFDNTLSILELRKIISGGEYKSHRMSNTAKKSLYKDLEYLIEILKCYDSDFRVVRKDKCEADDLVKPTLESLSINKNSPCMLVSVDMDWSRSTTDNIHWYNYSDVYTRYRFQDKYGFDPKGESVLLYKSLRGDSSDNIKPGVPYLPEKIVLDIVHNYSNVDDLMSNLWECGCSDRWKQKIEDCELAIRQNYKLVNFMDVEEPLKNYMYVCKENTKKLEMLFKNKDLPLESRMISHEKRKSNFLQKGDYK